MNFKLSLVVILTVLCNTHAITEREMQERVSKMDLTNTNDLMNFGKELFLPYREHLRKLVKELMSYSLPKPKHDYITCDICKVGVPLIRTLLAFGLQPPVIMGAVIALCQVLDLAPAPELCEPTVKSYAEPTLYILQNKPELGWSDFCGIINPGCSEVSSNLTDWPTNINPNKPPVTQLPPLPNNVRQTKILQITDIHLDLDYTIGAIAKCDYPICCRHNYTSKTAADDDDIAGAYGHFSCALPEKGLHSLYNHMSDVHKDAKYIFLTGDYIHSGIWLYGVEENTRHIAAVTRALKESFPNTPIYPLSGNHEPDVVNMYPPTSIWEDFPLEWMYDAVMDPFAEFVPADQIALFKRGGYYTVSPEPGFRLVIINSNLCYVNNLWLAFETIDPENQLQWLSDTLLQAETAGDIVYILGHISPGSGSCWPVWSEKYDLIINRFENIIKAQFYGHSHTDYLTLAFEKGTERAISTSYITPSGVSDGMNPGYKVFFADGERGGESTWEILNYETWILNITLSNALDLPVVQKVYDARTDYGLTSFRPTDIYDFVYRMIDDDDLFQRFQRNYYKGYSPRYRPCLGQTCKIGYLCGLVRSNSGDDSHCDKIREAINNKGKGN